MGAEDDHTVEDIQRLVEGSNRAIAVPTQQTAKAVNAEGNGKGGQSNVAASEGGAQKQNSSGADAEMSAAKTATSNGVAPSDKSVNGANEAATRSGASNTTPNSPATDAAAAQSNAQQKNGANATMTSAPGSATFDPK